LRAHGIPVPYYWIKFGDGGELNSLRYRKDNPDFWFKVANNGAKFSRQMLNGQWRRKGKHLEHFILEQNGFICAHKYFGGRSEFHKVFATDGVDPENFRKKIMALVTLFSCCNFADNDYVDMFADVAKETICNGGVYGFEAQKRDDCDELLIPHEDILKFVTSLTTDNIPVPDPGLGTYSHIWLVKTWRHCSGESLFVILRRMDGVLNWQYSLMEGMEGVAFDEVSELFEIASVILQDGGLVNKEDVCDALKKAVLEIKGLESLPVIRRMIALPET